MEAKAELKFLRMSPRKVKLVIDLIRGLDVEAAKEQLLVLEKAAARPVLKLLESAISNAKLLKMNPTKLFVKKIIVGAGPTLKRWRARAFGRAAPIRKRTCHIKITLAEKE